MVVPRDIRQQIERGDFDAVELAWLERLEEEPEDIDHFVSIGRSLVGAGQGDLARTLLQLVDDELKSRGQQALRLELLRAAGPMMVPKGQFHSVVLDTLRDLHGSHANLEGLIEILRLDRPHKDPKQTWDRVARLESLLLYSEGTVVWVDGHGPGQVSEVNYALESFKVDLEAGTDLRVGFRAAPKLLDALPDDHFVVRRRESPDAFEELAPQAVLEQVLTSFDRPMTGAEIRDAVQGLIERSRWNSWWTSAKKHPQVVASPDVRHAYVWAGSTEEASDALWQRFAGAEPRVKIDLVRQAVGQSPELLQRMVEEMEGLAAARTAAEPGLAFEIYCTLERAGVDVEARLEGLVGDASWQLLIDGVHGRQLRQRAYDMAREGRADWREIFGTGMVREADAALLTHLASALEHAAPEELETQIQRALAQPVAAPALFTWIAERAGEDDELTARLGTRLFKKILDAPAREAFRPYRKRLQEMAESGGTLPRLLAHVGDEEAADVMESIRRASGFSHDQRERLSDALALKFPALGEQEEPLWALPASIESKRTELKELLEDEIPSTRRAIETAREMGDLRENFEYKAARQRHQYLTARAEELAHDLGRSQPVDLGRVDCSQVRVGTRVRLAGADGEERDVTILGPWESDPEAGVLSYMSEVAQALLGREPGDEVALMDGTVRVVDVGVAEPA